MRITAKYLEARDACPEQVDLFRKVFPRGLTPTLKNLQKAMDNGLEVEWFGDHYLKSKARSMYLLEHSRLYSTTEMFWDECVVRGVAKALDHYGEKALFKI